MTKTDNTINSVASFIPRPRRAKGSGRPTLGNEVTPKLQACRVGIAKMRQRQFSWSQITSVLNQWGITCSIPTVIKIFRGTASYTPKKNKIKVISL